MDKEQKTMLAYRGIALNEEQISALKRAEDALNELGKLGVQLVLNQDTDVFTAINTNHLGTYEYNFDYALSEEERDKKVILDPFKFDKHGTTLNSNTLYIPSWDFVMVVDDVKTEWTELVADVVK